MNRVRDQRGSAVALEATLVIPAMVLFVALVLLLARNALADQAVGAAASQAARAASIERTVPDAVGAAGAVAASALAEGSVRCAHQDVSVDASGLSAPVGQHAEVTVTITCTIQHDLALPGFPASRTVVVTRSSPVDTFRGR